MPKIHNKWVSFFEDAKKRDQRAQAEIARLKSDLRKVQGKLVEEENTSKKLSDEVEAGKKALLEEKERYDELLARYNADCDKSILSINGWKEMCYKWMVRGKRREARLFELVGDFNPKADYDEIRAEAVELLERDRKQEEEDAHIAAGLPAEAEGDIEEETGEPHNEDVVGGEE